MDKLDFKNPSYNRETGETAWSMLYFGSSIGMPGIWHKIQKNKAEWCFPLFQVG